MEDRRETFTSFSDELEYHLAKAEHHARKAHDMLYTRTPSRSLWFKMALGRAQSILISLYKQELGRKEKSDDERRRDDGKIPHQDRSS